MLSLLRLSGGVTFGLVAAFGGCISGFIISFFGGDGCHCVCLCGVLMEKEMGTLAVERLSLGLVLSWL